MLDQWICWSIRNKLWVGIFTVLLIFWGIVSAKKLPFDALPDITNNQFQIITVCPNLAAEEVEVLVTLALEKNANNLPQLEEIRSVSRLGLSVVTVIFSDKMDPYLARQLLNEKIQAADIPPDIGKPELSPLSTGLGEIFQYLLLPLPTSEKKYTLEELRTWQDFVVTKMFNNIPGVAEVNSFGGQIKQYQIGLDPQTLSALEIDIIDIWNAVVENNQNSGAGYMDINDQAHFIRGIGIIQNKQALEEIAITKDEKYFALKEISKITVSHPLRFGAMSLDGEKEVVGGTIMLRKGENSQQVLEKIHKKIPEIEKALPQDLKIISYLDRSELIGRTLNTVSKNLLEGAIIVIFVLIIFLGNWRAGWIVASVIPLCLLFALGMMQMLGLNGNLMSLGAIDFGLLVDGAIIIVEACLHHLGLRENRGLKTQEQMDQLITKASIEIRNSAAFGEIIILIVYLPLLFLGGIEGKMFQPMAQTVMLGLLGAFILSLTYVPMMSALFLSKKEEKPKDFSKKILLILQKKYQKQLKKALRHPQKYLASTLILLLISLGIFSRLGGEFMPQLQEGDFAFHCILPTGSSLEKSIEVSMQAAKVIKSFPEVKHVIAKTGTAEIPTDPMPMEASDLIITLKDPKQWPQKKNMNNWPMRFWKLWNNFQVFFSKPINPFKCVSMNSLAEFDKILPLKFLEKT